MNLKPGMRVRFKSKEALRNLPGQVYIPYGYTEGIRIIKETTYIINRSRWYLKFENDDDFCFNYTYVHTIEEIIPMTFLGKIKQGWYNVTKLFRQSQT